MAKLSLVLVLSLVVALPLRSVLGDDSWQSLADRAASQGISQQSIDDAQAALRGSGDSHSSVWTDWIKGNANNLYTDENSSTDQSSDYSDGGSPAEAPEGAGFADIDVDVSSPADAPEADSYTDEAPTDSPTYAPQSQAPAAATPQAQSRGAPTPQAQVPGAPTPQAQAPGASTSEAEAPGAPTPEAEAPGADAPEAEAPGAVTPTADAPEVEAPGAAAPQARAPGAAAPEAA